MKLTIAMREAFVWSVLDDIPKIDFDEKCQILAEKFCIEKLPKELQKIMLNPSLKGFIKTDHMSLRVNSGSISVSVPLYSDYSRVQSDLLSNDEIANTVLAAKEQRDQIYELKKKVKAAIYSVTTLKQALELMPEFEKYLPKPNEAPSKYAPAVIANLAADLRKAGWTKGEKK